MMRRITADWDFKNPLKVLFYLNRIFKLKFISLTILPSKKKGFHIYLWTPTKGNKFKIRAFIGDDKKRIYMDKTHRYARNTLFNKKIKYQKRI